MGAHEDEFEASFRDRVDAHARRHRRRPTALLPPPCPRHRSGVQLRHPHRGAGRCRMGSASSGDCSAATCGRWSRTFDQMRWDVTSKVLAPAEWSPFQTVDFAHVPADGGEHDLTLFMEDTAWPHAGMLDEYLDAARDNYAPSLAEGRHGGRSLLELQAVFTAAWGAAAKPSRGDPVAEASPGRRASSASSPRRCPRNTARRAPGCTTRSACATTGRAACCGPSPGPRSSDATRVDSNDGSLRSRRPRHRSGVGSA